MASSRPSTRATCSSTCSTPLVSASGSTQPRRGLLFEKRTDAGIYGTGHLTFILKVLKCLGKNEDGINLYQARYMADSYRPLVLCARHSSTISSTGILVGSAHSLPNWQIVMSVRRSRLPICERRAVFRLFMRAKPRSQIDVSTAYVMTMATTRRML